MIELERVTDIRNILSLLWFKPNEGHIWAKVIIDGATVGIVEFQPITNMLYSLHAHIFKKYQKQGFAVQMDDVLPAFCWTNGIDGLLVTVPESNHNIQSVLNKSSFKPISIIPNAIFYNNRVDNLIMYTRTGFIHSEVN